MRKHIFLAALLTTAMAFPAVVEAETVRYDNGRTTIIHTEQQPVYRGDTFRYDSRYERDSFAMVPFNNRAVAQALQQSLKDTGFYKGSVSSIWDAESEAALASYQNSKGMPATGILNEETVTRLGLVIPAAEQVSEQSRTLANKEDVTRPVYTQTRYNHIERRLSAKEVQAVQQNLQSNGFYTANVDGIWGPKTTEGIRSFQTANGLNATGRLNNQTLDAMGLQVSESAQIVTPTMIEPASGTTRVETHQRIYRDMRD